MPKAWLCIPTARRAEESTVPLWRRMGYGIALFRDCGSAVDVEADLLLTGKYVGYAHEVNRLSRCVLALDSECEFVIAAGDDIEPDMNRTPASIAQEVITHFGGTFGLMQCTSDRWGDSPKSRAKFGENRGAYIDRVAGSPWIGREFARRIRNGKGPYCPEYYHMYCDEHLQLVAERLGVFWQRPDLIHLHRHWGRGPENDPNQPQDFSQKCPDFLRRANSPEQWNADHDVFKRHRDSGFAEDLVLLP